jgi:hypothetical protein
LLRDQHAMAGRWVLAGFVAVPALARDAFG